MVLNESFAELVKEMLSRIDGVTFRKMFGGMGIFHKGRMFALISGSELYLKTDATTKKGFEEMGMPQFEPFPDRPMKMPYHMVPPEVLEDPERLEEWANVAIRISK